MNMDISIKLLDPKAKLPVYGTDFSAGADLCARLDSPVNIEPGTAYLIHTGIAMEIPDGYAGFVFARSGLASKQGLAPSNKVGVIDSDYRGEILVSLYNQSGETRTVSDGDRIAQIVIMPYVKASWKIKQDLEDSVRGEGGFGSTGIS